MGGDGLLVGGIQSSNGSTIFNRRVNLDLMFSSSVPPHNGTYGRRVLVVGYSRRGMTRVAICCSPSMVSVKLAASESGKARASVVAAVNRL